MKTTQSLFLIALALVLSGCKTYNGQIKVHDELVFNESKNNKVVAGTYDASIKFENEKQVTLEISLSGRNNNPKVKFKLPKTERRPSYDGDFEILSAVSGTWQSQN
jgi:hypothetical protein